MKWTREALYANWLFCFESGHYRAARAWWALLHGSIWSGRAER